MVEDDGGEDEAVFWAAAGERIVLRKTRSMPISYCGKENREQ